MTLDARPIPTRRSSLPNPGLALLVLALAACRSDDKSDTGTDSDADADADSDADSDADTDTDATTPTVLSNAPLDGTVDYPVNGPASVSFSEEMDRDTVTSTFTLTSGPAEDPVQGTVIYSDGTATFWPADRLASDTTITATVTTGATSALGVALADDHVWTFNTGDTVAPGIPVDLGTAGDFVILAKSGVSTVPPSIIVGDIGVSPAAAGSLTGFSLTADATNVFSTSAQVTGNLYAADHAPPTPDNLTTTIGDMELALTDAAGRAPDVTELGAGDIGGQTLVAGVYRWGTGLLIPTDLTLDGSGTDVWIFQIAQDLTVSNDTAVHLTGGAQAENVFWQVSGQVVVGTTAHLEGVVLSQTAIALRTGASVNGRLLAQTAVTIDTSTVVDPGR